MSIPDYQMVMLPLLKLIDHHGDLNRCEASRLVSDEFKLTDSERQQLIPSGQCSVIRSRVGWARTYLKKAGLIDYPKRGIAVITERGQQVLQDASAGLITLDCQYLQKFPEFIDFKSSGNKEEPRLSEIIDKQTPDELLEAMYSQRKSQVLFDLVEKIKSCSPDFFEDLVVRTIVKLGYGGSRVEAGKAIGRSGDEGIDGVINEDRLGLDVIYLQAKRWEANVSRPEIQKFVGALHGKRAKKGIFITTSDFTSEARKYVQDIETKIILISGRQLAELMWEYNIGLNTVETYEIKKLDFDYFVE